MATKITKADLFDPAADTNSRGYKKNALTDGEPDQSLVENWAESTAWKTEDGDRATQSTGGEPVEDLKGLVQIGTDAEAKDNADGLEANTTKVPHTGQLPSVDATETQTVGALTDNLLEVTTDGGVTTRNNFLLKLKEGFRAWLDTLRSDVNINTTDIATNTSNIATNTSNIATNTSNIGTNTANIATNTSNIATNTSDIADNTAAIASAVTTTWASLSISNLNVTRFAGTGGTYAAVGTTGSIRYMVLDKTIFLSVSLKFAISSTSARTAGSYARIAIDLSSIGVVSTNQSISVFNATYNSGPTTSFDVASSSSANEIYNIQAAELPSGASNTANFTARGMIAVEIN